MNYFKMIGIKQQQEKKKNTSEEYQSSFVFHWPSAVGRYFCTFPK